MLSFKEGVLMFNLQPQLVLGLLSIYSVFKDYGYDCTVTSLSDSLHSVRSLHYSGYAVDLRIKHISSRADVVAIGFDLRKALGSNFDVVLEVDHIHVEYDPKIKEKSNVSQ